MDFAGLAVNVELCERNFHQFVSDTTVYGCFSVAILVLNFMRSYKENSSMRTSMFS